MLGDIFTVFLTILATLVAVAISTALVLLLWYVLNEFFDHLTK